MERLFRGILRHRRVVTGVFVALTVICACLIPQVKIDANMSDYLPPTAKSSQDLDAMKRIYGNDIANARVYVTGISLPDAKALDKSLKGEKGVISVTWLGDEVDVDQPLETQDADTIADWYDGKGYLFQAVLKSGVKQSQIDRIRALAKAVPGAKTVAIDGSAADDAANMATINTDMGKIMTIAVIVVLVVVALNTTSYLHPIVMLLTIGVAIVLNMGTNIFRGTISSITQLVASVLQLAVSMDYSIVLLTNFGRAQQETDDQFEAMVAAMTRSFPVILSSAAVTFFGFLSLGAMQFLIGADMGIALAKGIVCSFFSITLLMPCILYNMRKLVAKTMHKPFFRGFHRMAKVCHAGAVPALAIAAVLAVPALLASQSVSFTYGSAANMSSTSQVKIDGDVIDKAFGKSQTWAIMVPAEHWGDENALVDDLQKLPTTKSVLSYSTIASSAMPHQLADKSQIKQLFSGGYSRIVLTSRIPDESKQAFDLVKRVRGLCREHYGSKYRLVGNAVSYADIKAITSVDSTTVKLASILAIGAVLLVMFRSVSIPVILIMAIEVSIWMNEAVPYLMGQTINFVAFLVIDAVQLGAAVDYAIIFTEEYLARRRRMPKADASIQSIEKTAQPIMTSSSILILACLGIYLSVSSPMIQQVGMLIARGALISVILIFFVLPLLFTLLDGLVRVTSHKIGFYRGDQSERPAPSPASPASPASN
ncbi:MMPL family transporter [Parafannyhessea umbonata]|uniref:efflux RND transporter permease subunit n=1 Tax=Parafannyhessea umbonata TaxID=604330 RepID=UPI002A81BAA4|nr:MMPL family transporter [Parafannyhessea umbonata]MDY4015458.1 MMPL family transporter [Parafannyhessea umbonata]